MTSDAYNFTVEDEFTSDDYYESVDVDVVPEEEYVSMRKGAGPDAHYIGISIKQMTKVIRFLVEAGTINLNDITKS